MKENSTDVPRTWPVVASRSGQDAWQLLGLLKSTSSASPPTSLQFPRDGPERHTAPQDLLAPPPHSAESGTHGRQGREVLYMHPLPEPGPPSMFPSLLVQSLTTSLLARSRLPPWVALVSQFFEVGEAESRKWEPHSSPASLTESQPASFLAASVSTLYQ